MVNRKTKSAILFIVIISLAIGFVWWLKFACNKKYPNVLLVSIDTCRADHLSCYGFSKNTTPNIDAIAKEGIVFTNASSPVPLTLPAHCSVMTGTVPAYHGVRDNMEYQLAESEITLAEMLAEEGYKTAGVIAAYVLDSKFGLAQGFDFYDDTFQQQHSYLQINERRGDEVTRVAGKWLEENRDERFFLFAHYFDPHSDYRPPEPYASRFADDLYAGEIAYADKCIGDLIDKLKELGLYESTLIVIFGDHGEGLGEHRENEHSFFIYQSTINVPIVIKPPEAINNIMVDDHIGLIDIAPTILSYAGIDKPEHMHGADISCYLNSSDATSTTRFFYCESLYPTKYGCNPLYGLINERWKYIWTAEPELYNLKDDPGELNNIISVQPIRAQQMSNRLRDILATQGREVKNTNTMKLDEQSKSRLESLGYVGGKVDETMDIDINKPDAKSFIDYHRLSREYTVAVDSKEYEKAKQVCNKMLSQYPDVTETYYLLGNAAFEQGKMSEAAENFKKFLETHPNDADAIYRMGISLARLNDHQQAIKYFNDALKLNGDDYMIHGNLALSLNQVGQYDKAVEHYSEVLRLHPGDADAHSNMGISLALGGKYLQAIEQYEKALKFRPDDAVIHENLGKALIQASRVEEGLKHWAESLRINPAQPILYDNMANAYIRLGKVNEAINCWETLLKFQPDNYRLHYNLGLLNYSLSNIDKAVFHWEHAIDLGPDYREALNSLAWLFATEKNVKDADRVRAVDLANRACAISKYILAGDMDTLAAAYASIGDFENAVSTARKAKILADNTDDSDLVKNIEERIELYKSGRPYRQVQKD